MHSTVIDLVKRPEWLTNLLEICVEVEIAFARAQVEAGGAHHRSWRCHSCSQISPKMYRQFALPYEQRIFAAVHEMGAVGRLHICGNTTHLLPDMLQSGADIIDLDWMVDLEKAAQLFDDKVAICGEGSTRWRSCWVTPETVKGGDSLACIQKGSKRQFSGAGCEIPEETPLENLLAQHQALCQ